MDQNFGCGDVGGHRDIVHIAQAQKVDIVGFTGLRRERIAEKQQKVDLIAGNTRGKLLVSGASKAGKSYLLIELSVAVVFDSLGVAGLSAERFRV